MDIDLDLIRKMSDSLNINDDDLIGGIIQPKKNCKICDGSGIDDWGKDGSAISCTCILRDVIKDDPEDINITWKWLKFILNVTKEEVYGTTS